MKHLEPEHYWDIQTKAFVSDVPLYAIGFWNLLSDYLSHNAISKLRDLGTFYHLLPENPNAAEWLVCWLIGFAIGEKLQGVYGGMECIIDELVKKLPDQDNLHTEHRVVALERTDSNKLKLVFEAARSPPRSPVKSMTASSWRCRRARCRSWSGRAGRCLPPNGKCRSSWTRRSAFRWSRPFTSSRTVGGRKKIEPTGMRRGCRRGSSII